MLLLLWQFCPSVCQWGFALLLMAVIWIDQEDMHHLRDSWALAQSTIRKRSDSILTNSLEALLGNIIDFLWNYLKRVILIMSSIVKNVFHLICQAICDENKWLTSRVNLQPSTWKCSYVFLLFCLLVLLYIMFAVFHATATMISWWLVWTSVCGWAQWLSLKSLEWLFWILNGIVGWLRNRL